MRHKAAHIVHGFNVRDRGKGTLDLLQPHLNEAGYTVYDRDYGWKGLLGVRIHNARVAQQIANSAQEGDIGVGHSNGCTILAMAADAGAPFDGLILINPALPNDRVFAPRLKWVDVYYSTGDLAVAAAMALRLLPWNWGGHQWGDMGRVGYRGSDPRVRAFEMDGRHSDIFKIPEVLRLMVERRRA